MENVYKQGPEIKSAIIESISNAKFQIDIAMAYFTDVEIAKKLSEIGATGVKVTIILSDDPNNQTVIDILKTNCQIYVDKRGGYGKMHHKFCLIDNSFLLNGSYNYTYNALRNNGENLTISDSFKLLNEYKNIFEDLIKNMINNTQSTENPVLSEELGYLNRFTNDLKNHISQIFDKFNPDDITRIGFNLAKDNDGSEAIYKNYLETALTEVNNNLNQNDHTKTLVKTSMASTLDMATESIDNETDTLKNNLETNYKILIKELNQRIVLNKDRKNELKDKIDEKSGPISIIKNKIEELKDEIDSIGSQIVTKKLWVFPTYIKLFLLLILITYMSTFFASALWKIFFEETEVFKILAKGITPQNPPMYDADAIQKIFQKKGIIYGLFSIIFFLFPLIITLIKLIIPSNKVLEILVGWIVGIFLIDVVVSILISQHTAKIQSLVNGTIYDWGINDALQTGEFWLIFIFGSLPLFITKILIENFWKSYNLSNPEHVDRERFLTKQQLNRKLVENNQQLEVLENEINNLKNEILVLDEATKKLEDEILKIETEMETKTLEIKEKADKKINNLKTIYNSFISSVDSGNKIFLENVVSGRISAFKQGFYQRLNTYYASNVAASKIEGLENIYLKWFNQNFNN